MAPGKGRFKSGPAPANIFPQAGQNRDYKVVEAHLKGIKIEWRAIRCNPADIIRNDPDYATHGDIRGTGNMGCGHYIILENRIIGIRRFLPEDIQAGPGNFTTGKSLFKGIMVYKPTP